MKAEEMNGREIDRGFMYLVNEWKRAKKVMQEGIRRMQMKNEWQR